MKWNARRTFGVEIEFFGCTRESVAQALNAKGICAYVEGWNKRTVTHWKIVTDSSVNGRGCNNSNGKGNEIVSPILRGEAGLRELKVVLETLNECGAKVDKSCGIHVHHGVEDFTLDHLKNVYALYARYENVIDMLLPKSRRQYNSYCRPINYTSTVLAQLKRVNTYEKLAELFASRYYKVNHENYRGRGTVEFRQHSGSLEYAKVSSWIVFTQAIVERAKLGRVAYSVQSSNWTTLKEALKALPSMGCDEVVSGAFAYLGRRYKHWTTQEAIAA